MGHAGGVSTLLIPGAGEPNYDSRVADPFQGRKARREQEVHRLLDKLQPDMIVLNPDGIGQVSRTSALARDSTQQPPTCCQVCSTCKRSMQVSRKCIACWTSCSLT